MSSDAPPPLIDAVKASASRLKERQLALEARAKELDGIKAQLDAQRAELEGRAAKLAGDQEAVEREKESLQDVRASLERDLAAINDGRESLAKDTEQLRGRLNALEERERTVRTEEERVERLERALAGQMTESESKLHNLLERQQELIRLQTDWLEAFDSRGKELQTIGEAMHARQSELAQQHESLAALKDSFKAEVNRLLAEHEALATKEKSLREVEKYLSTALQLAEDVPKEEEVPAPQAPPPANPEPVTPPPMPEVTAEPEPAAAPVMVPVQEEISEEKETKPGATKADATERLSRAIEAWKRARDAGWKVNDIRKTVKSARDAIEAGDYEAAIRVAKGIAEQLQAIAPAR